METAIIAAIVAAALGYSVYRLFFRTSGGGGCAGCAGCAKMSGKWGGPEPRESGGPREESHPDGKPSP
jgi:hypothetical protein